MPTAAHAAGSFWEVESAHAAHVSAFISNQTDSPKPLSKKIGLLSVVDLAKKAGSGLQFCNSSPLGHNRLMRRLEMFEEWVTGIAS
jgi:hypothetical protein